MSSINVDKTVIVTNKGEKNVNKRPQNKSPLKKGKMSSNVIINRNDINMILPNSENIQ